MKLTIVSNQKLKQEYIDEAKDFTGFTIEVIPTTETIKPNFHVNNQMWYGDFNHIRSLFKEPTDARCFVTSKADLIKKGITQNLAAYDTTGKDTVYDFYMGLSPLLDARAKKNGFKSNLAWEIVHEMCHGAEAFKKNLDRVHGMEAQGKLKDLWRELFITIPLLEKKVSLLSVVVNNLVALFKSKNTIKMPIDALLPLVERKAQQLVTEMEALDMPIRITEGFRSIARQNEIYQQGRTKAGNIVTNSVGGDSLHQYGVAFDIVFRKDGYDAPDVQWKLLGSEGKKLGLEWGGDWTTFRDKPHFQILLGYTLSDFKSGKVDYNKFK